MLAAGPLPTVAHPPEQWSLPFWATWTPATAIVVVFGLIALALGWSWAADDRDAGRLADRLLVERPAGAEETWENLDPAVDQPAAPWWQTTAEHLFLRALAEERNGADATADPDPDRADRIAALLHAARNASPARAEVRYAQAMAPADDPGDGLAAALGTSRDVLALARLGALMLDAGRPEAALGPFRRRPGDGLKGRSRPARTPDLPGRSAFSSLRPAS